MQGINQSPAWWCTRNVLRKATCAARGFWGAAALHLSAAADAADVYQPTLSGHSAQPLLRDVQSTYRSQLNAIPTSDEKYQAIPIPGDAPACWHVSANTEKTLSPATSQNKKASASALPLILLSTVLSWPQLQLGHCVCWFVAPGLAFQALLERAWTFRVYGATSGIALLLLSNLQCKDFCRRVKMSDGPQKADIQQVFKRLRSAAANKVIVRLYVLLVLS